MKVHAEDSFEALHRQLGDLFGGLTRPSYYPFSRSVAWQPAVNVYHDADRFYLCVELAGLPEDSIHVDVIGNQILIRGDRPVPPPPASEGQVTLLRMEINSGSFERLVELPVQAEMASVSARLEAGFLWITVDRKSS
jgi:HSP20 family molecular chaperone IbpA